jgi:Protein of unknown function (DUF2948)
MTGGNGAADRPRLSARSVEDLAVVAALLQDAIVPLGDIAFIEGTHSFVLVLNRFRWETGEGAGERERITSGLRFDTVKRVQYRGIRRDDRSQFLSLLTISYDNGIVVLHFAGGGTIRLEVDALRCAMEDFGEPWPTPSTPTHDAAG